ncbi:threonylcarbamoyl-AMP synthase [Patescibacteria group bacterium]|nr:threonylcarbamoyl-AMP synthase [Patescibacteria group bacterium]
MIEKAVAHFRNGGIVIFPTDTLYGIGCAIDKEASIRRLYKIRRNPQKKPSLILVGDLNQALSYGNFTRSAMNLAKNYWPGPLTIIIRAKERVPNAILGDNDSIAIRMPNQPQLLKIISRLGHAILAPSANFHSEEAPKTFAEIDKKLLVLVDYAINISSLEDSIQMSQKPSTIIDTTTKPFKIRRFGSTSEKKINKAVGGVGK